MLSPWRMSIKYLEDEQYEIPSKDVEKKEVLKPPKIKGKHYTNMDFLIDAELNWFTPNPGPNGIYDQNSENSYFEQCFRAQEKLGEGSFGSVIKVESKEDKKMYAMKVSKEPFRNEFDRQLQIREVEHHMKLSNHRNIVTLHQAWEEDRYMFMKLELCEPCCPGRMMIEKECWRVLIDIASALAHIHSTGRGHFDVKVDNILLGKDNVYKLSDFGLMLTLGKTGEVFKEGDSRYLAPELIMAGMKQYTPKADIFSLGISILELAGHIELPSHGEVWEALRKDTFPLNQTKHISDDLFILITKMMAKNPDDRPTASEILGNPKVKAVRIESRMERIKNIVEKFNYPRVQDRKVRKAFYRMSCNYLTLTLLCMVIAETMINDENAGNDSEASTSQDNGMELDTETDAESSATSNYEAETSGSETASTAVSSQYSTADSSQSSTADSYESASSTVYCSTPLQHRCDALYMAESGVVRTVKRIKRESLSSLNSDSDSTTSRETPPTPPRVSPPSNQIRCDWVSIMSPTKFPKELSINKSKLHCPSESLLKFGISPLRLSKEVKREYLAKNTRQKMSPRNLTDSFDRESDEEMEVKQA